MVAYRNDDNFAVPASANGRVKEIKDDVIVVEYDDGTVEAHDFGRKFGVFAGTVIPHSLTPTLNVGDTFSKGDFLVYNSDYFTVDPMSRKQLLWKAGVLARTILVETPETHEDSSAISDSLAAKLVTSITEPVLIRVLFSQNVRDLVKPGESVDIESILCTIENPMGEESAVWGEEADNIMRRIGAINPPAGYVGVVERIEVFYNGDMDAMSPTLKDITRASNRTMSRKSRALGRDATEGRVEPGFQIEGKAIASNEAVIKVYITGTRPMGVGDKGVFGPQLKTVVGRVMTGENFTFQDRQPIDAKFGYFSLLARVVESSSVIGTTTTLLLEVGKRFVKTYRGIK